MEQQYFELICAVPFMYNRAEKLIHDSPATKRIRMQPVTARLPPSTSSSAVAKGVEAGRRERSSSPS
jgi:hypothetical protein